MTYTVEEAVTKKCLWGNPDVRLTRQRFQSGNFKNYKTKNNCRTKWKYEKNAPLNRVSIKRQGLQERIKQILELKSTISQMKKITKENQHQMLTGKRNIQ